MSIQPNFLIIMSDEHDPRVSTPYGHPFVHTPAMQRLADSGTVFDAAYCNSPLCVPSRASFMTGKHVHRIGVWDNGVPLGSDEPTWAHRLNALGYETALSGKMHFVGPDQRHGFQRRLVEDVHGEFHMTPPNWNAPIPSPPAHPPRRITDVGPGDSRYQRYDDQVAAQSIAYLSEPDRHEQPWVLCASFITPHFPLTVRQPYFDRYFPEHADLPNIPAGHLESLHPQNQRLRRHFNTANITDEQTARARAAYYGLVTFCDERIGKLLDAVEAYGLSENTVIVYVADHGELHGQHGMWWKSSFYEGASRIPFILRWPGHTVPGSRFQAAVSLLDLVRTMLDLAGADTDELDGRSLIPLLEGSAPDNQGLAIAEYEAHGAVAPGRMVRRGRFKLNYYFEEPSELYNLENDPEEFENLAARPEYQSVCEELTAIALENWNPADIKRRVCESQRKRRIVSPQSS